MNVKVENTNKEVENVIENKKKSDANCICPYEEEINIKFEEGFFDEQAINYDHVENIASQSLHESFNDEINARLANQSLDMKNEEGEHSRNPLILINNHSTLQNQKCKKSVKCEVCGKIFTHSSNLKRHKVTHIQTTQVLMKK